MKAQFLIRSWRSVWSGCLLSRARNQQGFTLTETLIALVILTFGILAAGQLMYLAMGSNSLSRSKNSGMTVAQDKLEFLADLYRRNPADANLTDGSHGPEQVAVTNPNDSTTLDRFNVAWTVSVVPDPRAGKVLQARQVRVTVTPIRTTGTTTNLKSGLNKVINVTAIFSPKLN